MFTYGIVDGCTAITGQVVETKRKSLLELLATVL